ncbi:MAG: ATP-dependent helicase [Candidatus Pacebacteria bacterium]|nr:ATP-dependent helicase [Candidatus Paceibacterota bacterium]
MKFQERYNNLNPEQKRAVDYINGPLMVIAGPGSGKTELLGVRTANIIRKTDTPPESVLCLTYTNSAATNMKERLIELIGDEAYKIPVYTFHSFCQKIIQDHGDYFYKGASFELVDEVTQIEIIQDILKKMDYDNPLSSFRPEDGYVYLRDIIETISDLKQGGVTPDEFEEVSKENEIILKEANPIISAVFQKRVNTITFQEVEKVIDKLKKIEQKSIISYLKPINLVVAGSLEKVVESGDKKNIKEWKNKWTYKNKEERFLNDSKNLEKLKSLSLVYKDYQKKMNSLGYYDFSDMIMEVIKKMEEDDLFYDEVREKYLYVLVDEFQDTSGVQMRFLNLLLKDEIDNNPNICTVGDDDQAIYRFQGAEISNILEFKERYPLTKIISLVRNYRSTKEIIQKSYGIVKRGEERLENFIKEADKKMISVKKGAGAISCKEFKTEEEEFSFVAKEVKKILKEIPPEEVAVIAKTHNTLKRLLPFFNELGIPAVSARKGDVLEEEHIKQIINILKLIGTLLDGDKKVHDEILSEVITYPFWKVERRKIWEVSQNSFKNRTSWIECMEEDDDLSWLSSFLLDLSLKAKTASIEEVLDIIIENYYKDYYFSEEKLRKNKTEYIFLMSSLKCFVQAVRDYRKQENIKTKDVLKFLEAVESNNLPIINKNPLVIDSSAVSLITAHGAKGKEYQAVFVLNCYQEEWASSKNRKKIKLFSNTPFNKAGESKDDWIRLFYVTLTRAKELVYFTFHKVKDNKRKENIPLEFLSEFQIEKAEEEVYLKNVSSFLGGHHAPPFVSNEKELLFSLVKNYKLSPTGLSSYLDITRGGPEDFFKKNILRFPEKRIPVLSYGTAVHKALSEAIRNKKEGVVLSEKEVCDIFKKALEKERLSGEDFKNLSKRGKRELAIFYKKRKDSFKKEDETEKNFENQNCFVEDVPITGQIDRLSLVEDSLEVTDFKTGKVLTDWNKGSASEKINLWKYRRQLVFYKILVEASDRYRGKEKVKKGVIDFVTPTKDGEVISLDLKITDEETERVKKLICAVGKRIKELKFDPEPKKEKISDIEEFENRILKEADLI